MNEYLANPNAFSSFWALFIIFSLFMAFTFPLINVHSILHYKTYPYHLYYLYSVGYASVYFIFHLNCCVPIFSVMRSLEIYPTKGNLWKELLLHQCKENWNSTRILLKHITKHEGMQKAKHFTKQTEMAFFLFKNTDGCLSWVSCQLHSLTTWNHTLKEFIVMYICNSKWNILRRPMSIFILCL